MTTLLKNPITYMFLIIVGLILYIMFRPTTSTNDVKIAADERKYDSLNVVDSHKMDSITSYYSKKMDSFSTKIVQDEAQITKTNQLIKSLQDAYNKEVPVINSFDVDALQLYFSNYRQQSDTTSNAH